MTRWRWTSLALVPVAALLLLSGARMRAAGPVPAPPAARAAFPDSLRTWLDGLGDDSLLVQVAVMDVSDTTLLYGRHAEMRHTPASLMKLITSSVALETWSPRTRLVTRAGFEPAKVRVDKRKGLRIAETLWVEAAGDPSLSRRDLVRLFQLVWAEGVDRVEAIRILPDTYGPELLGPGWMWDDAGSPYFARPSLLTVQGNSLWAEAGGAGWELPGSALLAVDRQAAPRDAEPRLDRQWEDRRDRFTFVAPLLAPVPAPRKTRWWVHPPEPACSVEHPDSLFRSACFEAAQEVFQATCRPQLDWRSPLPKGVAWLRHVGPPLEQVLDSVLTESWNLGAENVFQRLAVEKPVKGLSNWERAGQITRDILRDSLGVDGWLRQVDGSGLSRYNAVAPRQFAQLLSAMERRHPGRLAARMPDSGQGTLRKSPPPVAKGVRLAAKTGTLTGVTGLAGYLMTEGRPHLGFCVLITGQRAGGSGIRLRNQIVQRLSTWQAQREKLAASPSR